MARVLIVDDTAANRELMARTLGPLGHDLEFAADGRAALACIAAAPVDLVLLDLVMPGLDGFGVLEQLKAGPRTRMIPVIVVTASGERASRLRAIALGADDFATQPLDTVELKARVQALLRLKRQTDALESSEAMLMALGRSIEARDPDTHDHCERMARRVVGLGTHLGLDADALHALKLGAYLHDIGKVGIPDAVLLKPGPLVEAERALIQQHPVIGEQILRPLHTMGAVLPLVRHHHERLDGSGYPDGIAGNAIAPAVRILSAVDVFDALTTRRPYRPALDRDEALKVMGAECDAGWWDRGVVRALIRVLQHPAIDRQEV